MWRGWGPTQQVADFDEGEGEILGRDGEAEHVVHAQWLTGLWTANLLGISDPLGRLGAGKAVIGDEGRWFAFGATPCHCLKKSHIPPETKTHPRPKVPKWAGVVTFG